MPIIAYCLSHAYDYFMFLNFEYHKIKGRNMCFYSMNKWFYSMIYVCKQTSKFSFEITLTDALGP